MRIEELQGATPIDEEERNALIPGYIQTKNDLNLIESINIVRGRRKYLTRTYKNWGSQKYFKDLHKAMFGDVWKWAGQYRKSNKNIGTDWYHIPQEFQLLLDDLTYWIKNQSFDWKEIGTRFHHRIVKIHLFPNGNGRHARIAVDSLYAQHNIDLAPVWNRDTHNLDKNGKIREKYISSLRDADKNNYGALNKFMWD